MSRFLVWLIALSLLGSLGASRAAAQAPAGDGWRTVTSPAGYSFQVPADWQQAPRTTVPPGLHSVSCPSTSFCVAVGEGCTIVSSTDGRIWSPESGGACSELDSVSCASPSFCAAIGISGTILTRDGRGTWTPRNGATGILNAVSCAGVSFCVAVGGLGGPGIILTTTDGGATWTPHAGATNYPLFGVSCVSPSFCVAVGTNTILTSTDGSTWTLQQAGPASALSGDALGPGEVLLGLGPGTVLGSVSCASPSFCVALDDKGVILTSGDGVAWSTHAGSGPSLGSVSCPGPSFCVGLGSSGVLASDDGMAWVRQPSPSTLGLDSVSCASPSFCVAIGSNRNVLVTSDGSTWTGMLVAHTTGLPFPPGGPSRHTDTEVDSPDGKEAMFVAVYDPSAGDESDPSSLARDFFSLIPDALNISRGPEPIQVPNADSAAALTALASDPEGDAYVVELRAAIRGTAAFVVLLSAPEDSYRSDPTLGSILASFQLAVS